MAPAEVMTGLTSATHLFSSFLSTLSQNDGEQRDSILSLSVVCSFCIPVVPCIQMMPVLLLQG